MGKLALIVCGLISALFLTSCRKSYTCQCKVVAGAVVEVNSSVIKDTKRKAKKSCEKGNGTVGYGTETCTLQDQ